jgi:hypothetical protein
VLRPVPSLDVSLTGGVFLGEVERRIEAERLRLLPLFRGMPLDELLKAGQSGLGTERLGRAAERRKP